MKNLKKKYIFLNNSTFFVILMDTTSGHDQVSWCVHTPDRTFCPVLFPRHAKFARRIYVDWCVLRVLGADPPPL